MTTHGRRVSLAIFLLGAGLLIAVDRAFAECSGPAAACEEFRRCDLVFFGEVTDVDWASVKAPDGPGATVHFLVIEAFKGDLPSDVTITLSNNGEEPRFAFGQRVLVYLHRAGPNWTAACRRIHYAADVNDIEMSWLRQLRDHGAGDQVFGNVVDIDQPRSGAQLGQIRVGLWRDGIKIAETRTNWGGRFDLGWRQPGAYVLDVSPSGSFSGASLPIVVDAHSTCTPRGPIGLKRQ